MLKDIEQLSYTYYKPKKCVWLISSCIMTIEVSNYGVSELTNYSKAKEQLNSVIPILMAKINKFYLVGTKSMVTRRVKNKLIKVFNITTNGSMITPMRASIELVEKLN